VADPGLFGLSFFEEVLAIVAALAIYDYVVDEGIDRLWKRFRKSFLDRQGIS